MDAMRLHEYSCGETADSATKGHVSSGSCSGASAAHRGIPASPSSLNHTSISGHFQAKHAGPWLPRTGSFCPKLMVSPELQNGPAWDISAMPSGSQHVTGAHSWTCCGSLSQPGAGGGGAPADWRPHPQAQGAVRTNGVTKIQW